MSELAGSVVVVVVVSELVGSVVVVVVVPELAGVPFWECESFSVN